MASNEAFTYTVTGMESDLQNLTITLPSPILVPYIVKPAQEVCAFQTTMSVASSSKTSNNFVLSLGTPATASDVFSFNIHPTGVTP